MKDGINYSFSAEFDADCTDYLAYNFIDLEKIMVGR